MSKIIGAILWCPHVLETGGKGKSGVRMDKSKETVYFNARGLLIFSFHVEIIIIAIHGNKILLELKVAFIFIW